MKFNQKFNTIRASSTKNVFIITVLNTFIRVISIIMFSKKRVSVIVNYLLNDDLHKLIHV